MTALIAETHAYIQSLSWLGLLWLFWFVVIFEIPRYTLSFLVAALFPPRRTRPDDPLPAGRIGVMVAGHNEADAVRRCVMALREQSLPPDQILVISDGSNDRMPGVLRDLLGEGQIDGAHSPQLRSGKSAAGNLGIRFMDCEFVVIVDCDCSYDRHALRNLIAPMRDPSVGAVAGNLLVRNPSQTLVSTFQAIEYLISISLGRQAADVLGQVTCVSGAFGAFRRPAYDAIGGMDTGGGEDLDLTLRLRRDGWEIRFAADAICYTDVPETVAALVRQRFRWERDAIWLRYRKHIDLMNPFSARFRLRELVHEVEFLMFHVVAAAALPIYLVWLFAMFGDMAIIILLAAQAGLFVLDIFVFLLAAWATPWARCGPLLAFLPGYGVFNGFFMRFIRLTAYVQEWIFEASHNDSYVPAKVQASKEKRSW